MSAGLEPIRQDEDRPSCDPNGLFTSFSKRAHQRIDYLEHANVRDLHARGDRGRCDAAVRIKPFPLWTLVVQGLIIFFLAFGSARYIHDVPQPVPDARYSPPASANFEAVEIDAPSVSSVSTGSRDSTGPGVVEVTIKNMKFSPETVEVNAGDVVQWKNEDITPHTATSPAFDSGAIEADKTWRHRFDQPASVSYSCTFHPEMRGVIKVN